MVMTDQIRGVLALDGTTQARIERAALSLFAVRGVDGVTTREIAAESGISEGAIYRYYKSKEELARALFFAIHDRLTDQIEAVANQNTPLPVKAKAIVSDYCKTADDDWALFSYHLMTTQRFLPTTPAMAVGAERNPVAATENILRDAMNEGTLPKTDPVLLASMVLGVVLQTAQHKAYGRITGDLSVHIDILTNAVMAILKAQE